MAVLEVNNEIFNEQILGSDKPVLLDFYATWCGPCQMMAPVVEEIAEELGDKVIVGKINSDENEELVEKYNIMSIPTLVIRKNGQDFKTFLGVNEDTSSTVYLRPETAQGCFVNFKNVLRTTRASGRSRKHE